MTEMGELTFWQHVGRVLIVLACVYVLGFAFNAGQQAGGFFMLNFLVQHFVGAQVGAKLQ